MLASSRALPLLLLATLLATLVSAVPIPAGSRDTSGPKRTENGKVTKPRRNKPETPMPGFTTFALTKPNESIKTNVRTSVQADSRMPAKDPNNVPAARAPVGSYKLESGIPGRGTFTLNSVGANPHMPVKAASTGWEEGRPAPKGFQAKELGIPGLVKLDFTPPAAVQSGKKSVERSVSPSTPKAIQHGDKISFEDGKLSYTIDKSGSEEDTYLLTEPNLVG